MTHNKAKLLLGILNQHGGMGLIFEFLRHSMAAEVEELTDEQLYKIINRFYTYVSQIAKNNTSNQTKQLDLEEAIKLKENGKY